MTYVDDPEIDKRWWKGDETDVNRESFWGGFWFGIAAGFVLAVVLSVIF